MSDESTNETGIPDTTATDQPDAYRELLDRVRKLSYLADAGGVLSWDQQVTMPDGGAPA